MAMRELVEGECGGANPLMKFVSHVSQDKTLSQEAFRHPRHQNGSHVQELKPLHETSDHELVGEYFHDYRQHYGAPSTFHMDSLLHEIRHVESPSAVLQPHHYHPDVDGWTNEYLSTGHQPHVWVDEFNEDLAHHGFVEHLPSQVRVPSKWASEYLEEVEHLEHLAIHNDQSQDLTDVAGSLLECADDPRFANSKFFKFIKKLNSGEYIIEGNKVIDAESGEEVKTGDEPERWVDEYEATISGDAYKWVEEYADERAPSDYGQNAEGQTVKPDSDFWGKLEEEWYNMAKDNIDEHPWLAEYTSDTKEYTFEENNPMMDITNPFEEGLKKLREGDIIGAILLFEAEVQQRPDHAEAWQYLGTSQSENEQDNLAIPALNKCLSLQPENLTALMSLAVSYTNESLQSQACDALKQWLSQNPRYKDLLIVSTPEGAIGSSNLRSSMMSSSMYNEVRDLYIQAAQLAPHDNIDAEIQIGLGVLFNLSGEYDKAVDCFQTALQTNPQDALIWNKLGATLANGGRSEEAVEAYRHALELSPSYVRARYNLGISCVNLKVYREAVEHFLTSLNIQKQGLRDGRESTSTMSESIWTTLRMSLSLMGRPELHQAVDHRDLDFLNDAFNINIMEQPT